MAKYGILLPPKATIPKGFDVSLGGVPMPPVPMGVDFDAAVGETTWKEKPWHMQETWVSEYWPKWFREEREAALVHFTGENPPPEKNMAERSSSARLESFMQADREASVFNLDSNEEEEASRTFGGTDKTPS
jgi:hypothetical protein